MNRPEKLEDRQTMALALSMDTMPPPLMRERTTVPAPAGT